MFRNLHFYCFSIFICFFFCLAPALSTKAADAPPPPLLLANVYSDSVIVRDYWISEKLDGVRAYWTGTRLLSRRGNVIHAPTWFSAGFPDTPLDGELWMGRGTFAELSGIVRRKTPKHAAWRRIRFMVFDLPASDKIFDTRLRILQTLFSDIKTPYLQLIKQYKVADRRQLTAQLERVIRKNGEGLMLHKGNSRYRAGRTDDLLKLKRYHDAEAVVIAHLPGKGKYKGMLGALLVKTPEQLEFKIGTGFSDAERAEPPPVGSTITYQYLGKSQNGIPRFASFIRVREEM